MFAPPARPTLTPAVVNADQYLHDADQNLHAADKFPHDADGSYDGNPLSQFPDQPINYQITPINDPSWSWQVLPSGIIYHSYMASVHESRLSGVVFDDGNSNSLFDVALGGRVGILRYGTMDNLHPQGWQLDMEGAGFPRLALDHNWDVEATDFRFGVPLTFATHNMQYKFSYYHLSSHLGDEFAIRNPGSLAQRINYSRDAFVLGASWFVRPAWRMYAEADWAFHFDDGSRPWEFQFGIDYAQPGRTGICGTPFVAVNGHIRESVDFGGNFVAQAGWLWRGADGHTLRSGLHYYNGKSSQFEFFDQFERQIGFGVWYDQ